MQNNVCICLSHEIYDETTLSFDYVSRLQKSIEIFNNKNCNKIILTGNSNSVNSSKSEAQMAKDFILENSNIKTDQVIKIEDAKETVGEAIFSKLYLDTIKIGKIFVITSDWHKQRVISIFSRVFNNSYDISYYEINGEKSLFLIESSNNSLRKFLEWFKTDYSKNNKLLLEALIQNHNSYQKND